MGLLLQLFVVTTLAVVLHAAPLEQNPESTTAGSQPAPAEVPKPQTTQDSGDVKRDARDTTDDQDKQGSSSSTTAASTQESSNRPVRDVTDQPQRPPSSQTENKPTESTREVREAGQPSTSGNPPPPTPVRLPGEPANPPHPTPVRPPAGEPLVRPEPYGVAQNPNRPTRDTDAQSRPKISTLPARIPPKQGETQPAQTNQANGGSGN